MKRNNRGARRTVVASNEGKRDHVQLNKWMEDLQKELREVRQNLGQPLRNRKCVLFVGEVMADELPISFRPVAFKYDGTTDPWDHICLFENTALLHRFLNGINVESSLLPYLSWLISGLVNWEMASSTTLISSPPFLCVSTLFIG